MKTLYEVLEQLTREHEEHHVYRGQVREHPGPLVSSGHRPLVRQHPHSDASQLPATLRQVENVALIERQMIGSLGDRETLLDYQRRQLRGFIRGFFGYALTEVLCQQAGLASESLDITSDPQVAAFFATHDWGQARDGQMGYVRFSPSLPESHGIIYRWKAARPAVSFAALRSWSYTYCPPVLDSRAILRLFRCCDTLAESMSALARYRDAFRAEGGIMSYQGQERPFELLALPSWLQTASRSVRQHALLLVPDALENRILWEKHYADFPRPNHGFWDGLPMIEDFSKSRSVEVFRFRHIRGQADFVPVAPHDVASDQDIELSMVSGWLKSFMASPFGAVPILLSEELDLASLGIYGGDLNTIERTLLSGDTPGTSAAITAEADALSRELGQLLPQDLTETYGTRVLELTQKCSKERTWDAAANLLGAYRSKLSPSTHVERYLWTCDQLCLVLLKKRRYSEARAVSDDIFRVCESEHSLRPTEHSQRRLLSAYSLLFTLLTDAGLHAELVAAYREFIRRFESDAEVGTGLQMAHVRHQVAESLDDDHDFHASLAQYDHVIDIARSKSSSGEEASRLITTASFSRANCLEKLGDLRTAEQEFRTLADEFGDSRFEFCRHAASLAVDRANSIRHRLSQM